MIEVSCLGTQKGCIDDSLLGGSEHVTIPEALVDVGVFPFIGQCIPDQLTRILDHQFGLFDSIMMTMMMLLLFGEQSILVNARGRHIQMYGLLLALLDELIVGLQGALEFLVTFSLIDTILVVVVLDFQVSLQEDVVGCETSL